ncbi:hypothetical protein [Kiloniella sp.]|uniref:hypothetical protein n=1 Tax=Kiloniella sp. TaxID=1938587 RepID=UPI003B02B99C
MLIVIYLLYVKLSETIHINRLLGGRHLFLLNKAEKSQGHDIHPGTQHEFYQCISIRYPMDILKCAIFDSPIKFFAVTDTNTGTEMIFPE